MDATLRVEVLGPVVATVDGTAIVLRPREAAVLGVLALQPGVTLAAERVADAVWGESTDDLRPALQVQVSRVRRALGSASGLVVTAPTGYRLDVEAANVDAAVFAIRAAAARAALSGGRHREALAVASEALALWRGPALGGAAESWAAAEVRRLDETRLLAEEDGAAALAAIDPERAVVALTPLVDAEPLRERRWLLLGSALAVCGRQADALRTIDRVRRILGQELGVAPGPELVAFERQLLDQDPALLGRLAPRARLPAAVSRFIGRQAEFEELTRLCSSARLITLTGTGGTGKTRLGVALAERLAPTRLGGAWLIELDRLTDPEDVIGVIAATVAAHREGADPLARAQAALGDEPAVVVLDSCEHLLDGAAAAVTALLRSCPSLLVIATSREALGVPGEVAWLVPPLSLDPAVPARTGSRHSETATSDAATSDAVAMLRDRAAAANPHLDLSRWDAELAVVARAVDGLPLAIELAAARLRAIDPSQLAEALSAQLGVLVGQTRGGPARHATMRAALDWGAGLCSATELSVLAACSVFRGGFTELAALAVAASGEPPEDGIDVGPALEALVSRSLLTLTDGRFRALEPVRQWAEERLALDGRTDATITAHGEWAVELADAIGRRAGRSPERSDGATLEAEHANFIAAVSHALSDGSGRALQIVGALGHSWAAAGRRDALVWARDALRADPGVAPRVRARALAAAAELAGVIPDPATAVAFLREAVELARTETGSRQLGWALFNLGKELMLGTPGEGGGADEARACFREALEVLGAAGDPFGEAWALANLGYLALSDGDDAAAAAWYDRADEVAVAGPFPHVLAILHRERAVLASRRGDHEVALAQVALAVDSYRQQGDLWQLVNALSIGAEISWEAGRRTEALGRADEAVSISARSGYGDNVRLTAVWVAARALDLGLEHEARQLGQLVIEPLERRARLWPTTSTAVANLRTRFPDLSGSGHPEISALALADHTRSTLSVLNVACGAVRPA